MRLIKWAGMVAWSVSLILSRKVQEHGILLYWAWRGLGQSGVMWVSKVEIGWQETMDYIDLLVPLC